jgi:hypothetical protein
MSPAFATMEVCDLCLFLDRKNSSNLLDQGVCLADEERPSKV